MESRKCTKCKKNKNGDEFNGMYRMCIECLDKQKDSNTVYYNQKGSILRHLPAECETMQVVQTS